MSKEISEIQELISIGNLKKALIIAEPVYQKNKTHKDIVKLLAQIHFLMESYEAASDILSNFIANFPNQADFECYNNLGSYLKKREEYQSAIDNLNKAIDINSNLPFAFINLAEIYIVLRDFDQAEANIKKSLIIYQEQKINNHDLLSTIIHIYCSINAAKKNNQLSIELIDKYLKHQFNEDLFYEKASIDPKLLDDQEIKNATNKLLEYDQSIKVKQHRFKKIIPLLFGLAKYYEKRDNKESEIYYDLGNREIFNILRYNSYSDQKKILELIDTYENNFEKFKSDELIKGERNFFIVGTPRSGTTLTESIVSANEDVFAAGELISLSNLMEKYFGSPVINDEQKVLKHVEEASSSYIRKSDFIRQDHAYVVDKMPGNYLYLGFLQKILPGCKIIRTLRNPWDIAISLYMQRYVQNIPYSSSFFNIGVFMANYEAISLYWDTKLDEKRILTIKYEDLVENQNANQAKIYEFLNIKSKYDSVKRSNFFAKTASTHQVQKDIYNTSINKNEVFTQHKSSFIDSFLNQREYWKSRGISSKDDSFFGYKIQ
jgi:tetratricopeptide (TPR) repeat protein